MHYVNGKKLETPGRTLLISMGHGTWSTTQGRKEEFFLSGCRRDGYQLPPTSLRDQWLALMRRLFGEALWAESDAISLHRQGKGPLLDPDIFGERITYEAFAKILQR